MNAKELKRNIRADIREEFGEEILEEGLEFEIESPDQLMIKLYESPLVSVFETYSRHRRGINAGISEDEIVQRIRQIIRNKCSKVNAQFKNSGSNRMIFTGKTTTYVVYDIE